MAAGFAFWGCTGWDNSLGFVLNASSSDMIWNNPNQILRALSKNFAQVIFLQCHFLEPLASLREHKDGLGMFFGGRFSKCFLCPVAPETKTR